ncbi:MAG: MFS transporter [Alphaproteobacteria bacterium]|nr:MFS transporter [Alphaproteobacteria bacterium]
MSSTTTNKSFFGWRVMWAAFVVAVFGWGVGFYGPPIFLHTLVETRGWSVTLVSAAVTTHFLFGALVIANMPAIYTRFGLPLTTKVSALSLAFGIIGWANAAEPWQLFAATILSAFGWAGTSAMAINTILSPWFVRRRPAALSMAYNGASVGGVLFSPVWVFLIALSGFSTATILVGCALVLMLWTLSNRYFSKTPDALGMHPDGDTPAETRQREAQNKVPERPGRALWTSRAFVTCTAGFAMGLFAQIGIIAHLFSLLVPAMGAQGAGLAAGFAAACAVAGRILLGWLLPDTADRRLAAALTYLVQILGCIAFILADGLSLPLLLLGILLLGLGIGNVTSLPPLIAQVEFAASDVPRAIALSTAIGHAAFAFAPALFGVVREWEMTANTGNSTGAPIFFATAAAAQIIAAIAYLTGRTATYRQGR